MAELTAGVEGYAEVVRQMFPKTSSWMARLGTADPGFSQYALEG